MDAYLRLAAIAKARNNLQLSIELVVITHTTSQFLFHRHRDINVDNVYDTHMLKFPHRLMRL